MSLSKRYARGLAESLTERFAASGCTFEASKGLRVFDNHVLVKCRQPLNADAIENIRKTASDIVKRSLEMDDFKFEIITSS